MMKGGGQPMAIIKRSLTVEDNRNYSLYDSSTGHDFKIIKAKNSVQYIIGSYLSKSELDQIIKSGVDVTIVPYKKI
jgi:hypothetical protein